MKTNSIITNFTAGEFSPLLYGRVDLAKYANASRKMLNTRIRPQGCVERRSGTRFVAKVKDSSKFTRLIPFQFSTTQAYIIEFGNQYCRFYKDEAIITLTAQNITGITQANPAVVTYDGADSYSNGDKIIISGVVGMSQLNNREFTVANVNAGANTFELSGIDSTTYDAYVSGGTVAEIYEIATPYLEADLPSLQYSQNADYIFITHPSYAPRQITRGGHASWAITLIPFFDGPYMDENQSATVLTPAATTGSGVALQASNVAGINDGLGFQASDVGRSIRIKHTNWGICTIASVVDATNVTVNISNAFDSASSSAVWKLGAWCDYNGWPQCNSFHEQRFVLAGSRRFPNFFWMSRTGLGSYANFSPSLVDGTIEDDHSISYAIAGNQVSAIKWISSNVTLQLGTSDSEWIVKSSTISEPISPTNIQVNKQSNSGSYNALSVSVNSSTLYISDTGRRLMEMVYDVMREGYVSNQMTLLSEHIPIDGGYIKELSYAKEPYGIVHCVLNSGDLAAFTFLKEQEVMAWQLDRIGGVFGSGYAVVESVATIKAPDGRSDQTWLIVKRTINGETVRYIEFFEEAFTGDDEDKPYMFFVDSCLTYDGAATTTITGLMHLEGETVSVLADGAEHADCVVSGGKITLTRSSTVVQVGLKYYTDIWTLRFESKGNSGTSQGKIGRVPETAIRFHKSLYCKVGTKESDIRLLEFRKTSDPMDSSPPLFSGDKEIKLDGSYSTDRSIFIRQDKPYPMTILAIMPRIDVNE